MAISGEVRVHWEDVAPCGGWLVSEVEKVKDYDRSTDGAFVQAVERDDEGEAVKIDGEPLRHWQVTVMDGDPTVKRDKTFRVTILATRQPVPPEGVPGLPFVPVAFEGMTMRRWVNRRTCTPPRPGRTHSCGAEERTVLRATGMAAVEFPAMPTDGARAGKG